MKANVILKMTVSVVVEGDSMDQIQDWAIQHTPNEVVEIADAQNGWADVTYDEEVYEAGKTSETNIDIRKDLR